MDIKNLSLTEKTVKKLASKKIVDTQDLLDFIPKDYIDLKHPECLKNCINKKAVIRFNVKDIKFNVSNGLIKMTGITDDEDHLLIDATWFNQVYMFDKLNIYLNHTVVAYGSIKYDDRWGYTIGTPEYIGYANNGPSVYVKRKTIAGVSAEMMGKAILESLTYAQETLPYPVLEASGLMSKANLYKAIHFPQSITEAKLARDEYTCRLLYDFAKELRATYPPNGKGYKLTDRNGLEKKYIDSLPYKLTEDQKAAINKIDNETSNGTRLRLLVQGDVGCGKTTVAFALLMRAISSGGQAVMLAPTTVLAKQHYNDLVSIMGEGEVEYLSTEITAKERKAAIKRIGSGASKLIIGTHAVFGDAVDYKNLVAIVVDEEHKFGVAQREKLKEKAIEGAHVVSMSATPIPRSLATVLYGENCDLINIRTMPGGRKPIKTAIVKTREMLANHLRRELAAGRQAYIVCPRVEIDDKTDKESVTTATDIYKEMFPEYKVGMLHGKMKKEEISAVINDFRNNVIQILVSTTVVEVGVNVPNASYIVIENAEMFGLSSLHQLRGRVGRGDYQSYCVLISDHEDSQRLEILKSTTDGFEIAEADMKIRGTGNIVGLDQSGFNREIKLLIEFPDIYKKASKLAAI